MTSIIESFRTGWAYALTAAGLGMATFGVGALVTVAAVHAWRAIQARWWEMRGALIEALEDEAHSKVYGEPQKEWS